MNEHSFIESIQPIYKDSLYFYKGGAGFYNAGELSAKGVSDSEHKAMAKETYAIALQAARSGDYNIIICDEINNAVHDGLLTTKHLTEIITTRHSKTSICVTGRNFPQKLLTHVDIATNMTKLKHHFDDKYLANSGIDY